MLGLIYANLTVRPMHDCDGPEVAEAIYRDIFQGWDREDFTIAPSQVAFALDKIMRKMRDDGVPASRWAQFVHFGV